MELNEIKKEDVISSAIALFDAGIIYFDAKKDMTNFPINSLNERNRAERVSKKLKILLVTKEKCSSKKEQEIISNTLSEIAESFLMPVETLSFFQKLESILLKPLNLKKEKTKKEDKIFKFISDSVETA